MKMKCSTGINCILMSLRYKPGELSESCGCRNLHMILPEDRKSLK